METTIIDSIREWLSGFDGLSGGVLHVDYLPFHARSYTVDAVPCEPVVKRYLHGTYRQYQFVLASREFLTSDIGTGTYNLQFYERFERWVEEANLRHALPKLGEGRTAGKVKISSTGYPFLLDEHGTARYQIQLVLYYFAD